MATSQAMFGEDSWLDWIVAAQNIEQIPNNQSMLAYLSLLCYSLPLRNTYDFSYYTMRTQSCNAQDMEDYYLDQSLTFPAILARVLRQFFSIFNTSYRSQGALNTGAFFANDYLLSMAVAIGRDSLIVNATNAIHSYSPFELTAIAPIAGLGAIIVISVLVGLQVIGIVALLIYIYRIPVWTKALDSLALASIGAQLLQLEADQQQDQAMSNSTLGIVVIPENRLQQLWRMDGLIDPRIVHQNAGPPHDDVELEALPPPYAPRGREPASSEARPREANAGGETSPTVDDDTPPYT